VFLTRGKAAQAHVQEWRGKAATSRNKIEEARASQSENKARNNVLDSLTRLGEAGKVQGFHVSAQDNLCNLLNWC
jgi:structural maintenance of chromosome 4